MSRQEEMRIGLKPFKGMLGIGGGWRGVDTDMGGGAQGKGGQTQVPRECTRAYPLPFSCGTLSISPIARELISSLLRPNGNTQISRSSLGLRNHPLLQHTQCKRERPKVTGVR